MFSTSLLLIRPLAQLLKMSGRASFLYASIKRTFKVCYVNAAKIERLSECKGDMLNVLECN